MGKIVIATSLFPPEPVVSATLSYDLACILHEEGYDVEVISPRPTRPLNYSFPKERQVFPFSHKILDSYCHPVSALWGRLKESYSFGRALQKYIEDNKNQIDAIYANVWPFLSQYYLSKTAKKYNIPYAIHVQDVFPDQLVNKFPGYLRSVLLSIFLPFDKYVLRNAQSVIAISQTEADYLRKTRKLNYENIYVVRNWQNDSIFENAFKAIANTEHPRNFMYLGTVNYAANVEFLIDAFSKVDSALYHLSIIGNGSNREHCEQLAKEKNIDVEFGEVRSTEVPDKQMEADVLILNLRKGVSLTATPSKLTAYLFSGRPVVACVDEESDCANLIKKASCGAVVPAEDEQALINTIREFSKMSIAQLSIMGENSLKIAKKELSKKENLEKLSLIVKSLII